MADSFSSKLQLWDGWKPALLEAAPAPSADTTPSLSPERIQAEQLYLRETFQRCKPRDCAEPYTLQWFLDIEKARYSRQGSWIPRLLEFSKHTSETLLGIGPGLGTDWLQYAREGARVITCSPSLDLRNLVRRNFELRGLSGQFGHSQTHRIPVDSASIDVVCLESLLDHVEDVPALINEVYRVLKPGGKVLAPVWARYDVDFWCRDWVPWFHTHRTQDFPPARYSGRSLRRQFPRFTEHHVHKRHIRRSDMPHLCRWLPLPLLERLFGRILLFKGFKPLSSAIPQPLAA